MRSMIRKPTGLEISDEMPCHGCGIRKTQIVIEGEGACGLCGGETRLCKLCARDLYKKLFEIVFE